MPFKCSVPHCNGNYDQSQKVHVFSFPKNEELKRAWERAIPRKDFVYTKNSKVCERHFIHDDIEKNTSAFDFKSGNTISASLQRPRLKQGAVPKVFPNCPTYLNDFKAVRESPLAKQKRKEEETLTRSMKLSLLSKEKYDEDRNFSSFEELISCHLKHSCSSFWDVIIKPECILFLHLDISEEKTRLTYAVKINRELNLSVSYCGERIKQLKDKVFLEKKLENINDVHEVLEYIESTIDSASESRLHLNHIIDLVESLMKNTETAKNERHCNVLKFIKDQLSLLNHKPECYQYSTHMLIFSSLFYLFSPQAYKFVRCSDNIILPHPSTIHKICGKYSDSQDIGSSKFLSYFKQKITTLDTKQRYVSLMVDEIHIKQYLDFKGGNIKGVAHDSSELARSAFVFMLQSIFCNYKDVVYILPSKCMSSETLFSVLKKIILSLEKVGFKVLVVVTDNNSINRKTMSLFCMPPQLSYVYPHPADNSRPLFYSIDSVHLIKCVRNNWLNQKNPEQAMYFPSFDVRISTYCTASLITVKNLYEKECGKLLKYGYVLSRKALWPSNMERQNVKLALQLFDTHVSQSLIDLGNSHNLLNFESTANYINIFRNWFEIMNVKSIFKGKHSRNDMSRPLTNSEEDPKIIFLKNVLNWLDKWESMSSDTGRLTKETHKALVLTTCCILEIMKYCDSELNMSFLLPGKIQTDELEYRFSLYRRLSGTQYHVSIRQIFEAENKLRATSMLKLTLNPSSTSEIVIDKIVDDDYDIDIDLDMGDLFSEITVTDEDIQNIAEILPIVTYLAGYCAHSYLKKYKCNDCKENLVIDKTLDTSLTFNLIHTFDRGGLLFPSPAVINCVVYVYIIVQKLIQPDNEPEFLNVSNQRSLVCQLAMTLLTKSELLIFPCEDHSSEKITLFIIRSIVNTLLNNYCKNTNDKIVPKSKNKIPQKRKLNVFSSL